MGRMDEMDEMDRTWTELGQARTDTDRHALGGGGARGLGKVRVWRFWFWDHPEISGGSESRFLV